MSLKLQTSYQIDSLLCEFIWIYINKNISQALSLCVIESSFFCPHEKLSGYKLLVGWCECQTRSIFKQFEVCIRLKD
jgi:hypothetical protein